MSLYGLYIEEGVRKIVSNFENYMTREISHLIKFKYQPECQSGEWVNSIHGSMEFMKKHNTTNIANKFTSDKMEELYQDIFTTIRDYNILKDTGLPRSHFPSNIPPEFTYNNLINIQWVKQYLLKYAKDYNIKDYVNFKFN